MSKPSGFQLQRLLHININCTNLDASVEFYKMLGFEVGFYANNPTEVFPQELHAAAMPQIGLPTTASFKACTMLAPGGGAYLDIIQWTEPKPPSAAPAIGNAIGVPRFALLVNDVKAAYAELSARGVKFEGKIIGPAREQGAEGLALFRDPDGLLIELVELVETPAPGGWAAGGA